ncbi:MAG: tetratricopeptide repeat protein [Thermodesulfobacteriota bacterium]
MKKGLSKVLVFVVLSAMMMAVSPVFAQDSNVFQEKLEKVRALVDEVEVLKELDDPAWNPKVYEAFNELKRLYVQDRTSPDLYLLFAKCYWYNDRPEKAKGSLRKALYFDSHHVESLILKGDIISGEIKKQIGEEWYEPFGDKHQAKKAYETALGVEGLDVDTQSLINLKLGNMYEVLNLKRKARYYWQKAYEIAPKSQAGGIAHGKLYTSEEDF